jgi:hypothetical protein
VDLNAGNNSGARIKDAAQDAANCGCAGANELKISRRRRVAEKGRLNLRASGGCMVTPPRGYLKFDFEFAIVRLVSKPYYKSVRLEKGFELVKRKCSQVEPH